MISFTPVDIINRAEGLLESAAQRERQGPPNPEDIIRLLEAKQQVAAAVKLSHTEDDIKGRILDVLA